MLAHCEDRNDVGVVQQGSGLGLTLEPKQLDGPELPVPSEHLQCDMPAQTLLHGLVHDSHSTAADFSENPIVPEPLGQCFLDSLGFRAIHRGREVVNAAPELFHHHQGREKFLDLDGQVRMAILVLVQGRPFAAPGALGEIMRQLIQQVRSGQRVEHDQRSIQPPPRPFKISCGRRSARTRNSRFFLKLIARRRRATPGGNHPARSGNYTRTLISEICDLTSLAGGQRVAGRASTSKRPPIAKSRFCPRIIVTLLER